MRVDFFLKKTIILLLVVSLIFPQSVFGEISNGMGASDVIGQYTDDGEGNLTPNYTKNGENNGPSNLGFNAPAWSAIDTDGHYFFVSDSSNHRVLIYELDENNDFLDYKADYVLGQSDFFGDSPTTTQYGLNSPQGLAYDSINKRLFVSTLSRVMVFDFTNGITNGMNASYVIGQDNFFTSSGSVSQTRISGARGLVYDAANNRLFIAQSSAHRVTVYDVSTSTMANGIPATHVIGQNSFTTFSSVTTQTGMSGPYGLAYESETGRLFVAQYNNNRVLVYNASPENLLVTSTPATHVLGQPNFTSNSIGLTSVGMYQPYGLALDSSTNRLFVAQSGGNKVGVYDIATSTISNGMAGIHVLGQPDFNMLVSEGSGTFRLGNPRGVTFDHTNNRLYVVQDSWARISIFDVTTGTIANGMDAVGMLGQFTKVGADTYVPNYNKTSKNNGPNEFGLHTPTDMALDESGHRLFISDASGNRVLIHNLDANNQLIDYQPDYVLGQQDFNANTATTTQSGMNGPTGLAYAEEYDYLFVADTTNNRVLVFDVSSVTNGMNAAYVLGRDDFSLSFQSFTINGMYAPQGVLYDPESDYLFVADTTNHRVLIFSISPDTISNGMNAIDVLGQTNFYERVERVTQQGLSNPIGLAYDLENNRLFVGQSSNRISVFDILPPQEGASHGPSAIGVLGKTDYDENNNLVPTFDKFGRNNGPNNLNFNWAEDSIVDTTNHRLFVSERENNRVLVYELNNQGYLEDYKADYVLGKTNFNSSGAGNTQSLMNIPEGLAYDEVNQRLFVAQSGNHRVTVYDLSGGITNGMNASYVLGQSTFIGNTPANTQAGMNSPMDVVYVTSTQHLFVAQSGNHRVTVYDLSGGITNGMNASYVLGQSTFTVGTSATAQDRMSSPIGVTYDTLNNLLFVAQSASNRVTVYDLSGGITNGMNASYVLGQSTFTGFLSTSTQSGLGSPSAVEYDIQNERLFVSNGNRVTVYDLSGGITNGMNASYVLGQSTFTSNTVVTQSQSSTNGTAGLALNPGTNQLFVTQSFLYNRVSIFDVSTSTISNGMNAVDMLGFYSYSQENGFVPDYSMTGYNGGTTKLSLDFPKFSFLDTENHRLFISDSSNRRVIVHTLDQNNELIDYEADYVLGQNSFYTNTEALSQSGMSNPGGLSYDYENDLLFVADSTYRRVTVYDLSNGITNGMNASYVLGQSTFTANTAATTQAGLNNPINVLYDSTNSRLFVSDSNRVTVYDLSNGITNGMNASYVLGQGTFTAATAATTQAGMSGAEGLAFDSENNRLFVANKTINRVTVYDLSNGITNGMNASYVLGQGTFTANTASVTTQSGLSAPAGLAYNPVHQRLYVAHVGGVYVFDVSTSTMSNGMNAVYVFGKTGFGNNVPSVSSSQRSVSSAQGLSYDVTNHKLFVVQTGSSGNRVTIFDAQSAGANTATVDFPSASYVIGQNSFTESASALTQSGTDDPQRLSYDSVNKRLFVSENDTHRVMVYDLSSGITNGMGASYVIGQSDFITGTSGLSQSKMNGPRGVLYDSGNDRIYVADTNNARIMMFAFSEGDSLDEPIINSNFAESTSIQIFWSPVPGATSYTVSSTAIGSTVTTSASNYTFNNLTPNTDYSFQIKANNISTSSAYSDIFTTSTEPTLIISNVTTTNIGTTTATVSWTTNRLTSSRILYGFVNSFGLSTAEINTVPRVLNHEITLTGLLPCTVYHYTPRVVAAGGDIATTTRRIFSTTGCPLSTSIISSESSSVSSTTGGSIAFSGGNERVSLTVPSGFASTSEAIFQVKQVLRDPVISESVLPVKKTVVGSLVFDLKAISSEDSVVISEFEESVDITMTYDPSDLKGIDPQTLIIYRYVNGVWTPLSGCVVDVSLSTVTCETPGFSLFALFGEQEEDVSSISSNSVPVSGLRVPVSGSEFIIQSGAFEVASQVVNLTFNSPDAVQIAISNSENFEGVVFESYVRTKQWKLTPGPGSKVVYVKFRGANGDERVVSDTITLTDTTCPLTPERPYKSPSSPSVYYLTPDCTKRPIKNAETYFTWFASWSDVSVIPLGTLTSIPDDKLFFLPLGPRYRPTYGALIKTPYDPKVYVLINDTKYWITDEAVFTGLNYQSSWIEDVDSRLLDYYATGSEITDTTQHPPFTLIKYPNNPKVYRLELDNDGVLTKRWIVNESAFKALKFRGDRIITIPATTIYPDGPELK